MVLKMNKFEQFIYGKCPICTLDWQDGEFSKVWYGKISGGKDVLQCPACGVQFDAETFERVEG